MYHVLYVHGPSIGYIVAGFSIDDDNIPYNNYICFSIIGLPRRPTIFISLLYRHGECM